MTTTWQLVAITLHDILVDVRERLQTILEALGIIPGYYDDESDSDDEPPQGLYT